MQKKACDTPADGHNAQASSASQEFGCVKNLQGIRKLPELCCVVLRRNMCVCVYVVGMSLCVCMKSECASV